jgi:DNA repair exonuclease SbcCD ATPase subunit
MTFCATWGSSSNGVNVGNGNGQSILLTLDEPTANLDAEHCAKFAEVLSNLIDVHSASIDDDDDYNDDDDDDDDSSAYARAIRTPHRFNKKANIQFIIITHDHDFVERLGTRGICDSYYRVHKNRKGYSQINRLKFAQLEEE